MTLSDYFSLLIGTIANNNEVLSVGKSGGEKLPEQNESDIDIFVFCDQIPDMKARQATVERLGDAVTKMKISENGGRFWGICDFVILKDTEICLMYFTISDMNNEIESILNGSRLDREGEYFYPTGRCATFLSMYILYDKVDYIANMKKRLSAYPHGLAVKLVTYHTRQINDVEDFERAVSRRDVLFYHSTLEKAIDHFLQALFAVNKCFFPSRKRTIQFINEFQTKPLNCADRLLQTVELGAKPETLSHSYDTWVELCKDFTEIVNRVVCVGKYFK